MNNLILMWQEKLVNYSTLLENQLDNTETEKGKEEIVKALEVVGKLGEELDDPEMPPELLKNRLNKIVQKADLDETTKKHIYSILQPHRRLKPTLGKKWLLRKELLGRHRASEKTTDKFSDLEDLFKNCSKRLKWRYLILGKDGEFEFVAKFPKKDKLLEAIKKLNQDFKDHWKMFKPEKKEDIPKHENICIRFLHGIDTFIRYEKTRKGNEVIKEYKILQKRLREQINVFRVIYELISFDHKFRKLDKVLKERGNQDNIKKEMEKLMAEFEKFKKDPYEQLNKIFLPKPLAEIYKSEYNLIEQGFERLDLQRLRSEGEKLATVFKKLAEVSYDDLREIAESIHSIKNFEFLVESLNEEQEETKSFLEDDILIIIKLFQKRVDKWRQPFLEKVQGEIATLFGTENSDVTIILGDTKLPLHKHILARMPGFFRTRLFGSWESPKVIDLSDEPITKSALASALVELYSLTKFDSESWNWKELDGDYFALEKGDTEYHYWVPDDLYPDPPEDTIEWLKEREKEVYSLFLGDIYGRGMGVDCDFKTANTLFSKYIKKMLDKFEKEGGESPVLLNLGYFWQVKLGLNDPLVKEIEQQKKDGVDIDIDEMRGRNLKSGNNPEVLFQLWSLNKNSPDPLEIAATEGNHAISCVNLALKIQDEQPEEAFGYFKRAHELGSALGTYYMADSYLRGMGVEEDRELGIYYMNLAATRGLVRACNRMVKIYKKSDPVLSNQFKLRAEKLKNKSFYK